MGTTLGNTSETSGSEEGRMKEDVGDSTNDIGGEYEQNADTPQVQSPPGTTESQRKASSPMSSTLPPIQIHQVYSPPAGEHLSTRDSGDGSAPLNTLDDMALEFPHSPHTPTTPTRSTTLPVTTTKFKARGKTDGRPRPLQPSAHSIPLEGRPTLAMSGMKPPPCKPKPPTKPKRDGEPWEG
ncbi:hypothetical protein K474DRAFT_1026303 [Panus rudis PR-1116 ss-1]|nr:hypothetical protein K474DRAFT_1026303 [Panus rudis PR-1116 ss-1]